MARSFDKRTLLPGEGRDWFRFRTADGHVVYVFLATAMTPGATLHFTER